MRTNNYKGVGRLGMCEKWKDEGGTSYLIVKFISTSRRTRRDEGRAFAMRTDLRIDTDRLQRRVE